MTKAEHKTVVTQPAAVPSQPARAAGRRATRILIFILYAAAGWGLLALLWFGLIA
jgi:hypothetical protein